MRPGRPTGHVRAKWVTWRSEEDSELLFYELDRAGKLLANENGRQIHHRVAHPSCLTPKNRAAAPVQDTFGDGCEFDFGAVAQIEDGDAFWDTPNFFSGAFE
jgi:hypothetical protein